MDCPKFTVSSNNRRFQILQTSLIKQFDRKTIRFFFLSSIVYLVI